MLNSEPEIEKKEAGLSGKIILITGGSGGIGQAVCAALAARDAVVIDASIDYIGRPADFHFSEGQISKIGADITDPESVAALFAWIDGNFGRIDVLINNAGLFLFKPMLEIDPKAWRKVLAVNLDGAFYCIREALLRMSQTGGGQIINIGSVAGQVALPSNGAYGTSKAGLKMLTELVNTEFASKGIKATWLALGAVETDLWTTLDQNTDEMLSPGQVADSLLFIIQQNMYGRLEEFCLLPNYRYRI
ncbi:MAG: SDR family oxidoreductase [Saprospiraceae bacterium]|nr:SDR family oxidoreductase [Saprospiraceae bacterium]